MSATLLAIPTCTISGQRQRLLLAFQAAEIVAGVLPGRASLAHVEVRVANHRLTIAGNDALAGVRVEVSGTTVDGEATIVVPVRHLTQILKESSSPDVSIRLDGEGEHPALTVDLADGQFSIPLLVGVNMPPVSGFPADGPLVSLPTKVTDRLIRQSEFAADRDRTSPVLSGILLVVEAGRFTMAATDGKMLAEAVHRDPAIADPGVDGGCRRVVVPHQAIAHVQRIINTISGERIDIAFPAKLACFRVAGDGLAIDLMARTIEGSFPAYAMALDAGAAETLTVRRADAENALRRIAILAETTAPTAVIHIEGDSLRFSNYKTSRGQGRVTIPCRYTGSQSRRVGFSIDFLANILHHHGGQDVSIRLARGCIIPDADATFLLMPITLPD